MEFKKNPLEILRCLKDGLIDTVNQQVLIRYYELQEENCRQLQLRNIIFQQKQITLEDENSRLKEAIADKLQIH